MPSTDTIVDRFANWMGLEAFTSFEPWLALADVCARSCHLTQRIGLALVFCSLTVVDRSACTTWCALITTLADANMGTRASVLATGIVCAERGLS